MGKKAKTLMMALLLIFVALLSYYFGATKAESSGIEISSKTNEDGSVTKRTSSQVEDKLKIIKSIIDTKFLYDYKEEDTEEGIYKGFVSSLDDIYTEYYTVEEYKALNEMSEGSFGGVGIEVSGMSEKYIEVVAPIKGTPAEKAGIKSGDKIIKIDGEEFFADQLSDAVKVMRGEPGKEVVLTILRDVEGKDEEIDFKLIREMIDVNSVFAEMIDDEIAYIHITNFQEDTADDFFEAYKDLKSKGAKKLILDLRNNPGGLLDVTLKIADFLLPKGNIMSVKYKDGSGENYPTDDEYEDIPLVTLINAGSASASEVLSGALKDFKRSIIVGEKSFGKGVVQQVIPLGDGTGIKVTVAEYFSPNNNKIHGVGVKPDVELELNEEVETIGIESIDKDNQIQKAIELLNK